MSKSIGRKTWAIAEGYIPAWSNGPEPEFTSHEAFCVLNTTDHEAHIVLTLYYSDREPAGPYPNDGRGATNQAFPFQQSG